MYSLICLSGGHIGLPKQKILIPGGMAWYTIEYGCHFFALEHQYCCRDVMLYAERHLYKYKRLFQRKTPVSKAFLQVISFYLSVEPILFCVRNIRWEKNSPDLQNSFPPKCTIIYYT